MPDFSPFFRSLIYTLFIASLFSITACSTHPSGGYRIGRDPTWTLSPFNGITQEINAFTNAIVIHLSKQEKVPLTIVDVSGLNLLSGLNQDLYEGILAFVPETIENKDLYDFSEPILRLGPVLVVRTDSSADSLEDLKEKKVGIYAFDDSELIAQKIPMVVIRPFNEIPEALEALVSGKIDGALIPNLDAHRLVPTRFASLLQIVTDPLNKKNISLVTLKGEHKSLLSLFNQGLKQLKSSGVYLCLRAKFIF